MSENKKYYYLKLKDNFFDNDDVKILESMENGIHYSNLLLKLYLKSLKHEGKLQYKENIPYNERMIATITNLNIDTVRCGLKILIDFGFIEPLSNGTMFFTDIQNFIGQSSTEGDRKRKFRKRIEDDKKQLLGHLSDIRPPELEIRVRDKELEKENKEKIKNKENFAIIYKAYKPTARKTPTDEKYYRLFEKALKEFENIEEFKQTIIDYKNYLTVATWRKQKSFESFLNSQELLTTNWKEEEKLEKAKNKTDKTSNTSVFKHWA